MTDFVPHSAIWTREKSARFWDQMSFVAGHDGNYFSAEVGDSLIRFARARGVDLEARVLDFGCGPGHLVMKLLGAGANAEGADFSSSSVERLRKDAVGHPRFGGAYLIESIPTAFESNCFSSVFFIETIEHLLDDDLHATTAELHRIISPGGYVVVTTPNDEKLRNAQTVCPDCGCIFHSVQHVRSWTIESIVAHMSSMGFETVTAEALYLDERWWRTKLITAAARVMHKRLPNLVYIGRKRV